MLPHIASRIYGVPLLIHPDKAAIIAAVLEERLDVAEPSTSAPQGSRFVGTTNRQGGRIAMTRAASGIALITIEGTLVNRGAWLNTYSGMTSYEGIAAQVGEASADPEIKAIILDLDSPGGEATGMFSAAAAIRDARKSKRVIAVIDDMAASAAYGLASAADEIVISPTSLVGSIGVLWMHLDRSGELEKKGIHPTLIYAGARKVDGNSFGPMSERAAAETEKLVQSFYSRFLETVADGRGTRTSTQCARETEARVYIGMDAITAGLADRIGTLTGIIAELSGQAARGGGSRSSLVQTEEDRRLVAILSLPEARGHEREAAAMARKGNSVDEARQQLSAMEQQRIASSWRKSIATAGVLAQNKVN